MKTSRYRGHVLATITDRDLYYGGIGESYQVGQVLIFAAGTKPKPGSEMACADNMAAATEYLDGGGSPAAIPEPARLQEDPAPAPQAPSDGRLEAIVAEARMAAEALERDAAAQRRHTDALEAELAAAAAARDEAEAGRREADRQIEQAEKRAAESEAALRAATEALERAGEDRARLEGIVAVETAARAEAEAAERRVRQLDNGMSELISNISDERDLYANVLKERERLAGLLDDAESELSRRSSLADRLSEELQAAEKRAAQAENAAKEAALDSESLAKDLEHARARSSELETALAAAKAKAGTAEDAEERLRAALAELADVKAKRLEDAAAWQADLQRIDAQLKASRGNVVQTGSGEVVVRHVYPDAPKPTMAARAQSVAYTVGRGAVALVVVAALSLLASAILTAASNGASFGEGLRTVLGTVLDVIP